ncbi:YggL 50S ribosome-binding family protein [Metapseudomonas furukawaii]
MATNRSRRLRKKLCVDEFQELGFEITLSYKEGLDAEAVSVFFERFIEQAIEGNGLGFIGSEDYGFVCLGKRGSVTAEQRAQVEAWLGQGQPELAGYTVSPLIDVWYPENPVNA